MESVVPSPLIVSISFPSGRLSTRTVRPWTPIPEDTVACRRLQSLRPGKIPGRMPPRTLEFKEVLLLKRLGIENCNGVSRVHIEIGSRKWNVELALRLQYPRADNPAPQGWHVLCSRNLRVPARGSERRRKCNLTLLHNHPGLNINLLVLAVRHQDRQFILARHECSSQPRAPKIVRYGDDRRHFRHGDALIAELHSPHVFGNKAQR
jgi:hypothetical protein